MATTIKSEKDVEYEGIGRVRFIKSARARSVSISVRPFTGIVVTVPARYPIEQAGQFVLRKRSWIIAQAGHVGTIEQNTRDRMDSVKGLDVLTAKLMLKSRLSDLACRFGIIYNRVFVRHQKTRWGSCSSKDNININISLIVLPVELCDYVLIHELTHVRHKHHGPLFWAELDKLVEKPKLLRQKLGQYAIPPDNFLRP